MRTRENVPQQTPLHREQATGNRVEPANPVKRILAQGVNELSKVSGLPEANSGAGGLS